MNVKRVVSFDDAETDDVAALLALLSELHNQLNAAGVPPDGTLHDRVTMALERLQTSERVIREIYAGQHGSIPHPSEVWQPGVWLVKRIDEHQGHAERLCSETEFQQLKAAGQFSQVWKRAAKRWRESYHALDIQYAHRELERDRWKTAAKAFRRRWRDACAEIEPESKKPAHTIVDWLQAVQIQPTDVFETSDPYTIYASFDRPLDNVTLRALSGLNFTVRETHIRNRYMVQFVPSPDDEV